MKSGKILVVDDEPAEREGLARLVGQWGYEVETASSGEEALNLVETQHPAVVLTDLVLPEMDGLTAMREIRKHPEHAKLPIIALTAKAMRDDQERCLDAGMDGHIAKPVQVGLLFGLLAQVQEGIDRSNAESQAA